MAHVHEVDDPYIGFGSVLTVQPARVLLERALPGNRHRQHQGIERRVVKTFADQFPGGK